MCRRVCRSSARSSSMCGRRDRRPQKGADSEHLTRPPLPLRAEFGEAAVVVLARRNGLVEGDVEIVVEVAAEGGIPGDGRAHPLPERLDLGLVRRRCLVVRAHQIWTGYPIVRSGTLCQLRSSPAADDEHRGVHVRRRQERTPRQREANGQAEPSRRTRSVLAHHGTLQYEVGRGQPAVGRQQRPQQAGRNPVRRARHHPERPAGQPDGDGVRAHHGDPREPLAEDASPSRVQLDRDHPRPRPHQMCGQSPFAGPDVEHELAGPHPSGRDHPRRPFVSEPVPAPCPARPPGGGHDGPSPCSYPPADRSPPRPQPSIRFPGTARPGGFPLLLGCLEVGQKPVAAAGSRRGGCCGGSRQSRAGVADARVRDLTGFVPAVELTPSLDELSATYSTAEGSHGGTDERRDRFTSGEWARIDSFSFRSTELSLLAVSDRLIDLAETLLADRDLRISSAEAWVKYTGAADYDQPLHRDYLNQTLMVPTDDRGSSSWKCSFTSSTSPRNSGRLPCCPVPARPGCPRSRTDTRAKAPPTPKEAGSGPQQAQIYTMLRSAPPGQQARSLRGRREPSIAALP
jgi:hypothetical protein